MGVLNVILFLTSITVVLCKEYVPVLIWSTSGVEDAYPTIPALRKISTNEFTDYLLKRVKVENPMILVFMEENLSSEDFSWRDVNENGAFPHLSNITRLSDDVAFIPSVHEPHRGVKKLKNHGYVWKFYEKDGFESLKDNKNTIFEVKLDEPDYLEDRPDMLKRHDEQIAKIYNEALNYKSNVMVIYTGSHTSWIDADLGRFKREEKDSNVSETIVITGKNQSIRMAAKSPIVFKDMTGNNLVVINITKVLEATMDETDETKFRVRFAYDDKIMSVNFKFSSQPDKWWTLNNADIQELNVANMKPSVSVGAPSGYSYFCNPTVEFAGGNISLTFENFQVQAGVTKGNRFGPVLHCIPFFSIGIWSGLIVVFVLAAVLAWGITMIMDINTNDRFDDPKGKTITITASD